MWEHLIWFSSWPDLQPLLFFPASVALVKQPLFNPAASPYNLLPRLWLWAHRAAMADPLELEKHTFEHTFEHTFMLAAMTAGGRMLSAARSCWRCENCCSKPQPSQKCPAWALWAGNGCCFLPVHWNTPADWTQDRTSRGCISWGNQSASQPLASEPRCNSGTRRPRVWELELEAVVLWIIHAPHHPCQPGHPPP
jgi:hypothetical protein